jgi:hypothetical protein
MKLFHTFAGATLVLASGLSFAQAPAAAASTPRVDARQAHQEQRIEQGVATGTLTTRETRRLEREQTRVAKAEAHAKADGTVTAKERHHLHKAQDAASRDITRQKHDGQGAAPKSGN